MKSVVTCFMLTLFSFLGCTFTNPSSQSEKTMGSDKAALESYVKGAELAVIGRIKDSFSYKGMRGDTVGIFYLEIEKTLKGSEEQSVIGFTQFLKLHHSQQVEWSSLRDPGKTNHRIVVLLKNRGSGDENGDIFYRLVDRDIPTWWEVGSTEAKSVLSLLSDDSLK